MRIERLIVRKTKPTIEVIRDIPFNTNGLSLIIDNTGEAASSSGNNVGKTTAIKIIDLCLGAKSSRDLYYDVDTKSSNDDIKNFIHDYKVEAELVISDGKNRYSIIRGLYNKGKRIINEHEYTKDEFWEELKNIIFNLNEKYPTYRQLIPKFIRLSNTSADSMIKYLPNTSNDTYDAIYSYLFRILDNKLISKKNTLSAQLAECIRKIELLEKDTNISSLSILKQRQQIIDKELKEFSDKRNSLSYMEKYKDEIHKKRDLSSAINKLEEKAQAIQFDVDLINESILKLHQEKSSINIGVIGKIYSEAQRYIPDLQKTFEDAVKFHNTMIENRIEFISEQLTDKNTLFKGISDELDSLIDAKKKITIDILDEGLLDELNSLNLKIEELTLQKGEILQSIKILESSEVEKGTLLQKISEIETQVDEDNADKKMSTFNDYFTDYCQKLYGEKYLFAYNPNWKNEKKFPVSVDYFRGNVGTGKKKAVIVAFDLAYIKYAEELKISAPKFVIHDRLETTHINQLKTIFEICQSINGQYILPILRERVNEIDKKLIDEATVLELSDNDRFFRV